MYKNETKTVEVFGWQHSAPHTAAGVWQIEFKPEEDTQGRGYPDWIPENSTLDQPQVGAVRDVAAKVWR
ncbi:hypothetical protein [Iodobacter sp.]|uniref:hypothetical protein n=1 Tax=Iodobacter sp. TaxID=1915058 RepID=UPI0025D7AD2D|nr:hypothetical protein [Iodobacter sp.]